MTNNEIRKRAEALMEARNWLDALKDWELWFDSNTNDKLDPNSFHDRAICKFHTGSTSSAIEDLNRAVELQSDYSYRYASRGWMKQSNGDTRGAIVDYRKAIELDPEDAIAHNNLGLLEEAQGYKAQAEERFKVADELQELIDLSNSPQPDLELEPEPKLEPEPEREPEPEPKTIWGNIKSVFADKTARRNWVQFIRDGFTLKR